MSELARHEKCAPFACNAPLVLLVEPSHRGGLESLIVERCSHCGRVVEMFGVLPGELTESFDDGA